MPFCIDFNQPLFEFICVAFSLLAAGQTMHVFFCWYLAGQHMQRRAKSFWLNICYEASIIVFLISTAITFDHYAVATVLVFGVQIPIEVFNCVGLIPLVLGLAARTLGENKRINPIEIILFATAPAAVLAGSGILYIAANAVIGAQLLYRVIVTIQNDERLRRQTLTRFSIVDTINLLPSGVLCLTSKGYSLVMNESMRNNLVALELPIDPADLSNLWATLVKIAVSNDRSFKQSEDCLLIAMPDGTYNLFERGLISWNDEKCTTITATDVTEEEETNRLIEQSNNLILAAGKEIKTSLEDVARAAQNDALLSLRTKVHDIIGQRLSILHRLLEDDNISNETLAEITPLLNNLLSDLRIETFDTQAELDGIVSAFSLIDVKLEVEGCLPKDEDIAQAFVAIIREATTNAVRHAQAATVRIQFDAREDESVLIISNDYSDRQAKPGEGIGIPNMRKAVEAQNGTIEISEAPCFVVRARIPIAE